MAFSPQHRSSRTTQIQQPPPYQRRRWRSARNGPHHTAPKLKRPNRQLRAANRLLFRQFAASAAESTHLRNEILSARHGGRVSLMGGIKGDVGLPLAHVMRANMTIKGKWTYERDMLKLNKLVESGRSRVDDGSPSNSGGTFEVAASEADSLR